ncbi:MAG: hypothetical protein JWO36_4241 [Myxococcales bacterium]|nr:hypothetical protein [Myxococcales bacterium]
MCFPYSMVMTTGGDARVASRSTHAGIALGVLLLTSASYADADGEATPIVGLAVVGGDSARTPEHDAALVGVAFDLAWWHGRFGLAAEASERWSLDPDGGRGTVLGVSARFRVLERLMPSLLDPRDVELGLELQAIVERTWWNVSVLETDPTSSGVGLAIRIRGGADPDGSTRLAESRFFVRVMTSRWTSVDAVARTTMPAGATDRAVTVLVGIGASFGGGTAVYADRFRLQPFEPSLLW